MSPKIQKPLPAAKAARASPPRLIGPKDLPSMGIHYSISHLRRMWNENKFPPPVYTSARRFAWHVEDLENWIATRIGKPARENA